MIYQLNALFWQGARWKWSQGCAEALKKLNDVSLSAHSVLAHYDPYLTQEASCHGIRAVLSHQEYQWYKAYHSLCFMNIATKRKKLCPNWESSIVTSVQKFNQYVHGCKFTLVTNYWPLTTILGEKKGIPPITTARMQRWGLLLSLYT